MLCPRRQIIMMRRVRRSSTNDSAELFSSGNSWERWTFQWLRVYTILHYHTLIGVCSFFSINSHYWILSNLYCDYKKKFQEFCTKLLSLKQLRLKFEKIKIFIALWQSISFFKVYFVFGFCNVFIILVLYIKGKRNIRFSRCNLLTIRESLNWVVTLLIIATDFSMEDWATSQEREFACHRIIWCWICQARSIYVPVARSVLSRTLSVAM